MRRSSSHYFQIVCACALFIVGSGCSINQATGRNELVFISTPSEVAMGQEIHGGLKSEFKFSEDAIKVGRLNRVGQRVAQVSDRQDYPYQFFLIEKDEINAFTIPGGKIYMFTGLMDRFGSDDELASVLAHEIGHCAARHTIKKFQAGMGYNLIGTLILSQLEVQAQTKQVLAQGSGFMMQLIFSAYGRADEFEADKLGVKYMYLAHFKPEGMVKAFELLQKESKGDGAPLILRSHPFIKDRIIKVKEEISKLPSE